MKKLIAIVMMLLPMIAWGQQTADSVWFELQPDGMFYDIVAKWFKKGELKKGDRVKYEVLNLTANSFIQVILNPSGNNKDANEDW